jgi:hypothetical protein
VGEERKVLVNKILGWVAPVFPNALGNQYGHEIYTWQPIQ